MRRRLFRVVRVTILTLLGGGLVAVAMARAEQQSVDPSGHRAASLARERDLYLEVFIDGRPTEWVAHFRETGNGLVIDSQELKNVGIDAHPDATGPNAEVYVRRLPGVSYRVDETAQSIFFEASLAARSTHTIEARRADGDVPKPQAGYGGVLNYLLFGNSNNLMDADAGLFEGVSAGLDARLFSPFGTLSQSMTASTSGYGQGHFTRLDTVWAYSDPGTMISYRAGDIISGGLSWTRPVRLGGFQVQRNFGLRPDLVTIPLPDFGGIAAVPSTVEILQRNTRMFEGEVPPGPFKISNLPVSSGAGMASIVLRDSLGRETRTTAPYFVSDQLLQAGLWDFSAELGFARRSFGIASNDYDDRIMGSGSVRYGLNDSLTLEGHVEGGGDLINGGFGAVLSLGSHGVVSVAGAGSRYRDSTGGLVNASLRLALGDITAFGRIQQTFGTYDDIASVTAETAGHLDFDLPFLDAHIPETLAQVGVSMPVFDKASLNLSFTHVAREHDDPSRIFGLSYSQPLRGQASVHVSAFADVGKKDQFGVFFGLSFPLGGDVSVSTGVNHGPTGTTVVADAVKSGDHEPGSVGWRLHMSEGAVTNRLATVNYRSGIGRLEGGVQQVGDAVRISGQVEGAIAVAGGGVFLSNRVDDAFAIVNVGVPDVEVLFQNRPVGMTGHDGRLLVPDLNAYEHNRIAIDPANLPVDADIPTTREVVVPADRSGVVVDFGVKKSPASALAVFIGPDGAALPVGSGGVLDATGQTFFVGYDGKAYLQNLEDRNDVTITRSDGASCHAAFPYAPQSGTQVELGEVLCQ